jgi:hypothetical protein
LITLCPALLAAKPEKLNSMKSANKLLTLYKSTKQLSKAKRAPLKLAREKSLGPQSRRKKLTHSEKPQKLG